MSVSGRSTRQEPTSRRASRAAAWAAGALAVALTASACSGSPSGPKAAESASKMAADAKWLATQVHGVAPATTPFTVTQEGTKAVSCGHGKSRYSFAGHQSLAIVDPGTFLNLTTSAGEGLLKDRGYALDGKAWEKARASDGDDRATRPLTDGKAAIHLTVTAAVHGDSPSTELWTVTARTDCLRTG